MALFAKENAPDPVVRMPTRRTVDDLEAQLSSEVRRDVQSGAIRRGDTFGSSEKMRKGAELVLASLTAADKDGAAALERSLAEAAAKTEQLKEKIGQLDAAMDQVKRRTAENILELGQTSTELIKEVERHLEHVTSMLHRREEESAQLKQPMVLPALPPATEPSESPHQ